MNRAIRLITVTVLALLAITPPGRAADSGVERLYVLDCGQNTGRDQSRWSPGVNESQAIEFSDNCYLIRHARGWLLWDTGIPDAVAAMPDGMVVANGAITFRRARTLTAQLDAIGVKPADVTFVALSHTHGDHVGTWPSSPLPPSSSRAQSTSGRWPSRSSPPSRRARRSRSSRATATCGATVAW